MLTLDIYALEDLGLETWIYFYCGSGIISTLQFMQLMVSDSLGGRGKLRVRINAVF